REIGGPSPTGRSEADSHADPEGSGRLVVGGAGWLAEARSEIVVHAPHRFVGERIERTESPVRIQRGQDGAIHRNDALFVEDLQDLGTHEELGIPKETDGAG